MSSDVNVDGVDLLDLLNDGMAEVEDFDPTTNDQSDLPPGSYELQLTAIDTGRKADTGRVWMQLTYTVVGGPEGLLGATQSDFLTIANPSDPEKHRKGLEFTKRTMHRLGITDFTQAKDQLGDLIAEGAVFSAVVKPRRSGDGVNLFINGRREL